MNEVSHTLVAQNTQQELTPVETELANAVRAFNTAAKEAKTEIKFLNKQLSYIDRGNADFTGALSNGGTENATNGQYERNQSNRLESIARSIDTDRSIDDMLKIDTHGGRIDENDLLRTVHQLKAFGEYEISFAYPHGYNGTGNPTPINSLSRAAENLLYAHKEIISGKASQAPQYTNSARNALSRFQKDHDALNYTNQNYQQK
jgi:hypothetical protein